MTVSRDATNDFRVESERMRTIGLRLLALYAISCGGGDGGVGVVGVTVRVGVGWKFHGEKFIRYMQLQPHEYWSVHDWRSDKISLETPKWLKLAQK